MVILTVDGIDGSGKSTFARELAAALVAGGQRSVIVHVDDFRRQVDWQAGASEADVYYDRYYDLALCERTLQAFAAGVSAVTIPRYDPALERVVGETQLSLAADVLIVEGVFPQRVPAAAAGFILYLDVDYPCAKARILERDQQKGRSRRDIEHRIHHRYFPCQERYHAAFRPRDRADVMIANDGTPVALRRDLSRLPARVRQILDGVIPTCQKFDSASGSQSA